ncbi:hypothetical protein KFK09_021673 [Dendrobium nobile]|uniref:Uncharacterized protein n=1 Tax=Dendrobium nobile TaxID=94219 RepID=A0A8T3AQQ4_DENNO|nr:hypothetical protein KFK09_021673 [Dendrobium nobile]
MPLRRTLQQAEIEDLQQEIIRLKRRMSRLEQRKGLRPLARDFVCTRPQDYQIPSFCNDVFEGSNLMAFSVPLIESSFDRFEDSLLKSSSLPIYDEPVYDEYDDDDEEGILDDQISSTPPSIEFSFEEIKDSLPKSSSLPIFDEPGYDVYDDNLFFEFLHVDTHANNDDKSKPLTYQQTEDALSQGMEALQLSLTYALSTVSFNTNHYYDNVANYMNQMTLAMSKLGTLESFLRQIELPRQQTLQQMHQMLSTHHAARTLLDGATDIGWKYPCWFSQPNPPPYCGKSDIFL